MFVFAASAAAASLILFCRLKVIQKIYNAGNKCIQEDDAMATTS